MKTNPLGLLVYAGLTVLICWCFGQFVLAPLVLWLRGLL